MRTSSEKHLVEQLQLVLTLCGKVSSSYTMLHQGLWDDAALFGHFFTFITLAPKKLIRTRRASEGSASEPSLARRVSMCKDAKLSCRGNRSPPVKRRGFQTCRSCRVGRLSPLARHPNCPRGGCLYQFTPPGMDCARRTPRSGERGS